MEKLKVKYDRSGAVVIATPALQFKACSNLHNTQVEREAVRVDSVLSYKKQSSSSNKDAIFLFWTEDATRMSTVGGK